MKTNIKPTFYFLTGMIGFILFIVTSDKSVENALNALKLCLNTVVPTLLPSLVFSGFITRAGVPQWLKKALKLPLKLLFGLPESCSEIWGIGAVGGYPLSFITAVNAVKYGKTDKESAAKAALVSFSPGVCFSLICVGVKMYGNIKIGVMLYGSVLLSQLITAKLPMRMNKNAVSKTVITENKSPVPAFSVLLTEGVDAALTSLMNICVWIVFFGALSGIAGALPLPSFFKKSVYLAEVTEACLFSAEHNTAVLTAFCMGFGGVCVFLQLLPCLKTLEVSPLTFLLYRFVGGVFSSFFMKLMLICFPNAVPTAVIGYESVKITRGTPLSCVFLLFFAVVFIADTKFCLQKKHGDDKI